MKNFILCFAALATLTVAACSDDDTKKESTNACTTCTIIMMGVTSSQEVCNIDGNAYIDGTFVGNYQGWIDTLREQEYTCQN